MDTHARDTIRLQPPLAEILLFFQDTPALGRTVPSWTARWTPTKLWKGQPFIGITEYPLGINVIIWVLVRKKFILSIDAICADEFICPADWKVNKRVAGSKYFVSVAVHTYEAFIQEGVIGDVKSGKETMLRLLLSIVVYVWRQKWWVELISLFAFMLTTRTGWCGFEVTALLFLVLRKKCSNEEFTNKPT
jgi:hypothetical protein